MPIIGLTHDKEGHVKLSRTVTTKIAIGLPPKEGSNFPTRLDHFVFLRKVKNGKDIQWENDPELSKHYGQDCREMWIVFLDDDIEKVFRTEYAAYVKRGKWCSGDGVSAMRRDLGKDGKEWNSPVPFGGPCAEGGCPHLHEEGNKMPCAPSGDLYFMLADYPTLGSICRLHTSSYQSIRQIHSALQDLRRITGGRLMGVAAKLFMHPDKSVFEQKGQTMVSTKWVMGLELRAQDMVGIQQKMLETARAFASIKGELAGQVLSIDEDDEERGTELTPEFYPPSAILPAIASNGNGQEVKPTETLISHPEKVKQFGEAYKASGFTSKEVREYFSTHFTFIDKDLKEKPVTTSLQIPLAKFEEAMSWAKTPKPPMSEDERISRDGLKIIWPNDEKAQLRFIDQYNGDWGRVRSEVSLLLDKMDSEK